MSSIFLFSTFVILLCVTLDSTKCQECTPEFCDSVKLKCKEVICVDNQKFVPRGSGLCDCCPSCINIKKYKGE